MFAVCTMLLGASKKKKLLTTIWNYTYCNLETACNEFIFHKAGIIILGEGDRLFPRRTCPLLSSILVL